MVYSQMKTIALVALIAILTAISGCSVKTLYNKLDYLIPEYVAGMVTLDDALEEQVEQRALTLISWHRNTQLKEYADWLRQLQQQVGAQLTEVQIQQRIDDINQFYRAFIIQFNQEMAQILPQLNEQQRSEMFSHIAHKNEKFREKYVELNDAERIEAYTDSLQDSFESWLGDLTPEQEQAVSQTAQTLQSTAELRLWRRLQWQKGVQQILSSQDSQAVKTQGLIKFLSGFENIDSQASTDKSEANHRIMAHLTVQIVHSMTEEQNSHFVHKTDDYIRMLIELAENR